MDGFGGYKTAATEQLPEATTVMDPFYAGGAATASMTTGLDPSSRRRGSARGHEVIPDEHLSSAIQLVYELITDLGFIH